MIGSTGDTGATRANNICVYGCNFGNYRNELNSGIDKMKTYEDIDYYFFTDIPTLQSNKWNIIRCPMLEGDDIMDSCRWTAKYTKFVLPDILKEYEYVVWCDCKLLVTGLVVLNKEKIMSLFTNTDCKIVNVRHPARTRPEQELRFTITLRFENKINGLKFLDKIKNIVYSTPLIETCLIIRKTDTLTNNLLKHVFHLLKKHGLKRDQNVYNTAIHELEYPVQSIQYINMPWISAPTGTTGV